MATYNTKPIDAKREEFRKYLERSGVLDALTKVLVSLYEESNKPENALEYIRKHLGGIAETVSEVDALKKELDDLRLQNTELKEKLVKRISDEPSAE